MVVGASALKIPVPHQMEKKFLENHIENFSQPLEVVLFSRKLEIPEIFLLV